MWVRKLQTLDQIYVLPVIVCRSKHQKVFSNKLEALEVIQKLIEMGLFDQEDFEITELYGKCFPDNFG